MSFLRSAGFKILKLLTSGSVSARAASFLISVSRTRISSMDFLMVLGVIPCLSLYACWIERRRVVSSIVSFIASLIRSAYITTLPLALRAARPTICTRLVVERKKPILSASRMPINDTSGRSIPSRRRLIPMSTSNSPARKPLRISTRSMVSTSL